MHHRSSFLAILVFIALVSIFTASQATQTAAPSANQPQIKRVPPAYTDPSSGEEMFHAYCASCHGQSGQGNGPAAPAMKTPPANLTLLAAKNGGKFPELEVAQAIKGDSMTAAHGSKEMPVWGPVFLYLGHHDQAVMQLRVRNLTKYLDSLQQR